MMMMMFIFGIAYPPAHIIFHVITLSDSVLFIGRDRSASSAIPALVTVVFIRLASHRI